MMRRRPIARMAVTTAVVAGTATAVGGHMQRKQAQAAQASRPRRLPPRRRRRRHRSRKTRLRSWRSSASSTHRAYSPTRSLRRRRQNCSADHPGHGRDARR